MTIRLTGRHVLLLMLGFFAAVIGANGVMVAVAIDTFAGVEEDGAYLKGLAYNERLAQKAAEAELGYRAKLEVARDAAGTARADVTLSRDGAPSEDLTVSLAFRHPTNAHLDRTIALTAQGGGRFTGETAALPAGAWDVAIVARNGDATVLETKSRLWLR